MGGAGLQSSLQIETFAATGASTDASTRSHVSHLLRPLRRPTAQCAVVNLASSSRTCVPAQVVRVRGADAGCPVRARGSFDSGLSRLPGRTAADRPGRRARRPSRRPCGRTRLHGAARPPPPLGFTPSSRPPRHGARPPCEPRRPRTSASTLPRTPAIPHAHARACARRVFGYPPRRGDHGAGPGRPREKVRSAGHDEIIACSRSGRGRFPRAVSRWRGRARSGRRRTRAVAR